MSCRVLIKKFFQRLESFLDGPVKPDHDEGVMVIEKSVSHQEKCLLKIKNGNPTYMLDSRLKGEELFWCISNEADS
jgi:hypothetical protein